MAKKETKKMLRILRETYEWKQEYLSNKVNKKLKEKGITYKCSGPIISQLETGNSTQSIKEERLDAIKNALTDIFFVYKDHLFENVRVNNEAKMISRIKTRNNIGKALKQVGILVCEHGGLKQASEYLGIKNFEYVMRLRHPLSKEERDIVAARLGSDDIFVDEENITIDDYENSIENVQETDCDGEEQETVDTNEELLQCLNVSQDDWNKFCLLCEFMDTDPTATISEIIHNLVKDARNRISGKDDNNG